MAAEAAKRKGARARAEDGQSVLELIFMLPVLIGLVVVMVRTSSVIQMSIVNQRYVRSQALWLAFNSPYYPRLALRTPNTSGDQFVRYGFNRMVIGMADQPVDETGDKAIASTQVVTRLGRNTAGSSDGPSQTEPLDRASVRVRTTVALCTQPNVVVTAQGLRPATSEHIGEKTVFDYCRGQDE